MGAAWPAASPPVSGAADPRADQLSDDLASLRIHRGASVALATTREVQARFVAGTSTQLEVIRAERDALDAEVARIRSGGELSLARLVLQRAAGQARGS